jgi:hypothetical protein
VDRQFNKFEEIPSDKHKKDGYNIGDNGIDNRSNSPLTKSLILIGLIKEECKRHKEANEDDDQCIDEIPKTFHIDSILIKC